jgi:glycosyltransferase involved in cell wall biosynthesis
VRRTAYAGLAAVVALTRESASWLARETWAHRVPVIPNAAAWPLPAEPGDPARARRILLAVGRLSPEKNYRVLVDVFARLAPVHRDWDLAIVGEGPERAALEARVTALGLRDRVSMPGSTAAIGSWYARADLFALTSEFEGFPTALAEALAHGVPAVSFDCDTGPRDIVRDGVDGTLVPPGDAEALQRALHRSMGDASLRARFAERAVEVRERLSLPRIAGMWEALFTEVRARGAA